MKQMTSEERIENVELAGFSAWFKMLCDESRGVRFSSRDAHVPHDTAWRFLLADLASMVGRRCRKRLSDAQWQTFIDGARAMDGADVYCCTNLMAIIRIGGLSFAANRFKGGVELLMNTGSVYTGKIGELGVNDALALIRECVIDESLLESRVEPYRAALKAGIPVCQMA